MMNGVEAPLTPPAEAPRSGGRKLSVTFDLSGVPGKLGVVDEDELLSPSLARSCSIGISAQAVPDTILVALLDRDEEMRQLVRHNTAFFNTLRSHLYHTWPRFENTLYCPRARMNDHDWMDRISKALQAVPPLLQQFKDLVGYMGNDDDDGSAPQGDEPSFASVDLARIRDFPDRVARLRQAYPQFIIHCQNEKALDPARFFDTLLAPRSPALPDDVWEMRIYDQLDRCRPDLLAQLKEIVEYEIECGIAGDPVDGSTH